MGVLGLKCPHLGRHLAHRHHTVIAGQQLVLGDSTRQHVGAGVDQFERIRQFDQVFFEQYDAAWTVVERRER